MVPWSLDWLAKSHSSDVGNAVSPNCVHGTAVIPEARNGMSNDVAFNFTSKKSNGGSAKRSVGFIK